MTPASVAASLDITMLEATMLIESMDREMKRLSVRQLGHVDRLHILGSLRAALRLLAEARS